MVYVTIDLSLVGNGAVLVAVIPGDRSGSIAGLSNGLLTPSPLPNQWHGSTQKTHNKGRIIKMLFVSTSKGKRKKKFFR